MAFTWHAAACAEAVVNLGPLALIQPLLDQLDIAGIIDRFVAIQIGQRGTIHFEW